MFHSTLHPTLHSTRSIIQTLWILTVIANIANIACGETPPGDAPVASRNGASAGNGQDSDAYVRPSPEEIRKRLSRLQFRVTQRGETEPAFHNAYYRNKQAGIYVDIVSGEPLFSSRDKFRSGTGWPSFNRPLVAQHIVTRVDWRHGRPRMEVRSRHGKSHLGHVFTDGPRPTGLRFCINSAALRFVPAKDLETEGYGEFSELFENPKAARTPRRASNQGQRVQ